MPILYRRVLGLCLTLLLVATSGYADYDFAIELKSGAFTPGPVKSASSASAALLDKHIFIQFDHPLTDSERDALERDGIVLLDYVPNFAYTARLDNTVTSGLMSKHGIRWFDGIKPDQKISEVLTEYGIFDWARRGDNLVQFVVVLHRDEDASVWQDYMIREFDATILGHEPTMNALDLIVPEPALYRLSDLDAVVWIEQAMPFPEEDNNDCRANTGAEILQASPWNLAGSGVTVAEWDGGRADNTHADFLGRMTFLDAASISDHATHVAGSVMGDGFQSGGAYRGMAPAAHLLTQLWWNTGSEASSEYSVAINNYDARIATNSWGYGVGDPATQSACEATLGNYYTVCGTIDNIVRGSQGAPINIAWSAGNQRGTSSKYCGSIGWTYNTIGAISNAKNIITVGAINSNNNTMTSFSSWGPSDDGRVKPDVVGPGCQSNGDGGVRSTLPGGGYGVLCGTSMSTPVVAGVMALLLEQWDLSFGGDTLLPSTVKGVLINSAQDLGNPGPDYAYGHGKVDGVAAITKMGFGEGSYVQSELSTGDSHLYDMTVPGGTDLLRVTIVWDDPGGVVNSTKHLINDLDLVLIDPFSGEEYPWVLDPLAPSAPAGTGIDRVNNVETVGVPNPTPGLWKARVTGFNIPNGPQSYTIVFTPDGSNTPGNLAALAVYDAGAQEIQPGASADLEFWVSNVGAQPDSVTVSISDTRGWTTTTVTDSIVYLGQYDSALFVIPATIPPASLAGEADEVLCSVASVADPLVAAQKTTILSTGAFYNLSLNGSATELVNSPDTVSYSFTVTNSGNDTDYVWVSTTNDSNWISSPESFEMYIDPGADSTVEFSYIIPAEVPDNGVNMIQVDVTSDGGAADMFEVTVTASNPFFPPQLLSPEDILFTQDRVLTFEWDGTGDTYGLFIATDSTFASVVRSYTGLSSTVHTMPSGDALADGGYYWGVKMYVGTDSSSLQRYPRIVVVDNVAPTEVEPFAPSNNGYVDESNVLFSIREVTKAVAPQIADESYSIELASDSLFSSGVTTLGPFSSMVYQNPDPMSDGRWYWRTYSSDAAGNVSAVSDISTFVLDTETPSLPTPVFPTDFSAVLLDPMVFRWTGSPPVAWETAPEYYYVHVSLLETFSEYSIFTGYVHADSLVLPGASLTEGTTYYWRLKALDSAGQYTPYTEGYQFAYQNYVCGDVNNSGGQPDISDLTFLVSYLFLEGNAPPVANAADVNCSGDIDISDLTGLVNFLFLNQGNLCCL